MYAETYLKIYIHYFLLSFRGRLTVLPTFLKYSNSCNRIVISRMLHISAAVTDNIDHIAVYTAMYSKMQKQFCRYCVWNSDVNALPNTHLQLFSQAFSSIFRSVFLEIGLVDLETETPRQLWNGLCVCSTSVSFRSIFPPWENTPVRGDFPGKPIYLSVTD